MVEPICLGLPGCYKELYGYHTSDCPCVTEQDRQQERKDETNINIILGK